MSTEASSGPQRGESRGPTRSEQLAMTGLATFLASPALMHGLKGHLHNLAMLTELLQKETANQSDATALRTAAQRRSATLRTEIEAMHRHVRLIEALSISDGTTDETTCDVRASLQDVLPTTRFEAASRRVTLRLQLDPAVERVACAPLAFQQLMLAFVTQAVRHCSEASVVTITATRDDAFTHLVFECDRPLDCPDQVAERRLLGMLANRFGAQFVDASQTRVSFKSAA